MTDQEINENNWYSQYDTDHAHCPYNCEHPQPFMNEEDLICGRCWFVDCIRSVMIPCIPSTCDNI